MNDRQKTVLVHAINHFGVEANIDKALEEMGELTTELSRRRLARYDKKKVAEEIADVLITVEKLRIIFGGSRVDEIVEEKLARLEDEMAGDWRRQERMMPKTIAVASQKRRTTNGDPVEAAFHGEVWARCRLCGKAYEQQSEVKGELPGESYCPWCNGYGKEDGSHE